MCEFLKNEAILLKLQLRKTAHIDHHSARRLRDDGVELDLKRTLMFQREPFQNSLVVRRLESVGADADDEVDERAHI